MSDLLDCEVDAVLLPQHFGKHEGSRSFSDRDALIASLAREALTVWWMTGGRNPRADVIARAFGKPSVFNRFALRTHDFTAFRNAWIAEFRRFGVDRPEDPEVFFSKQTDCHCNECAAKRAA
jgi:hypothetical protein